MNLISEETKQIISLKGALKMAANDFNQIANYSNYTGAERALSQVQKIAFASEALILEILRGTILAADVCIDGKQHEVNTAGWFGFGGLKPGEQRSDGCCLKCGKAVF